MRSGTSNANKHINQMRNSLSAKLSVVLIVVAMILITASLISVFIVIHKERDEYDIDACREIQTQSMYDHLPYIPNPERMPFKVRHHEHHLRHHKYDDRYQVSPNKV